jgi:hypothetical protein
MLSGAAAGNVKETDINGKLNLFADTFISLYKSLITQISPLDGKNSRSGW